MRCCVLLLATALQATAIIPDSATPIHIGFSPSNWTVKELKRHISLGKNRTRSHVPGDNRRGGSLYNQVYPPYPIYPTQYPPLWPWPPPFPTLPPPEATPMPTISPVGAIIRTLPKALTLVCDVETPYEHIAWWLYPCPRGGYSERIPLAQGALLIEKKNFNVKIAGRDGIYTSSLDIKDVINDSSSGLYECESFPLVDGKPLEPITRDYFIVGKSKELLSCFGAGGVYSGYAKSDPKLEPRSAETMNPALQSVERYLTMVFNESVYREPRVELDTKEYVLRIPFNKTVAQEYKVRVSKYENKSRTESGNFTATAPDIIDSMLLQNTSSPVTVQNFTLEDAQVTLSPPEPPNTTDIPVQNSSFVRFDFTGGEHVRK